MPKPGKKKGGQKGGRQNEPQPSEPAQSEPRVEVEPPMASATSINPEQSEEVEPQASSSTLNEKKIMKEKRKEMQKQAKEAAAAMAAQRKMKSEAPPVVEPPSEPPKPEPKVEIPEPKPAVEVKVEEVAQGLEDLSVRSTKKRRPRKKKGDETVSDSQLVPPPTEPKSTSVPPQQSDRAAVTSPPSGPPASSQPTSAWGPSKVHVTAPTSATAQPSKGSQVTSPPSGPSAPAQPTSAWGSQSQVTLQPSGPSAPAQPTSAWGSRAPVTSPSGPSAPTQPKPAWGSQPQVTSPPSRPSAPIQPSTSRAPSQVQVTSPPAPKASLQQKPSEPEVCRFKIPLKNQTSVPYVGKSPTVLITNYLRMDIKALQIRRYDISFTPDRPKKMIPIIFKELVNKKWPGKSLAFDQMKNCYSLEPLIGPDESTSESSKIEDSITILDMNGKNMKFHIVMKFTGIVNLQKIKNYMQNKGVSLPHPTEEIQCIDVILRQGTLESYVKAGRQFFKRPTGPIINLGQGYEMWTGLFQSAIFTSQGYINVDVAHKGFPIHDTMVNLLPQFNIALDRAIESQRGPGVEYFKRFYKGLRVLAYDPLSKMTREYICNDLVAPPVNQKFLLNEKDGKSRQITVADYFSLVKRVQLKYPYFNCMWVGPKDKSIYIPIELLKVSYGQPIAKQLNELQVATMVRQAATPPSDRMDKIKDVISEMKYSTNPEYKRFGLDISNKFHQVNAKVLSAPSLLLGPRDRPTVVNGQWSFSQLHKPAALSHWGVITVEFNPPEAPKTLSVIANTATSMGMKSSQPIFQQYNVRLIELNQVLHRAIDAGVKILFVGIAARGKDHYHKIKQLAEREVGMLTQCIKEFNFNKANNSTIRNILLKVNSKLMGVNQVLAGTSVPRCLQTGRVMIVGADVTHPSPDQSNIPSIAAVTASMDNSFYTYNIELSIQTPKKEMIVDFEAMMMDHLRLYKQRNQVWPTKIYVFRDGVSEGQFSQVMNSELTAVYQAYARLVGPTSRPEVLFLLVQKRHHTRFFTTGGRIENVKPGTVVDQDIVHPSQLDFYLVSHSAIKGTARPTRYHAVCNDGKLPDEEVEQLAFYLCHLYSRCMRSVSYPTPTYYAHLACLRARSLTYGKPFNNNDLEKTPVRLRVLQKMLDVSRMFFV